MKTYHFAFASITIVMTTNLLLAQNIDTYFSLKPGDITIHNSTSQEYDVTLKWQNLDAIHGNKINCNAVKATYLIAPKGDVVSWKNVRLAQIKDFQQKDFEGVDLPAFDSFTYNAFDTAFLSEQFYEGIPREQQDLAKWLVSDAVQMQGLAWYVFDSLEFQKEFYPEMLKDYDITFENWVSFSSRYQKLIWSGITKHNNEVCAIVKFESFYNPVKIDNEQMVVEGRSLFFGEMWISLQDKQVEYASMVEDVVMKLKSSLFPDEKLIDLQREVVFDKVN